MKKVLSIAISSALLSSALVSTASAELTGNIGATSNYLWRGASQSANGAAVSGGLDYAHDSGVYVGAWGSTLDGGIGESDFYAGFSKEFGDFSFDLGYIAYIYSGAPASNFGEVYLGLSYSYFSLQYSTLANNTVDGEFGDASYIEGAFDYEVSEGLSVGVHVGSTLVDKGDDVVDYNLSLTKSYDLGDASFLVSHTDVDEELAAKGYYSEDVLFSITWSSEFNL